MSVHGDRSLDRSLGTLVGGKTADRIREELQIECVGDLLGHYPRRYEQRGQLTDMSRLQRDEHVTVRARVVRAVTKDYRDRRRGGRISKRIEITVTDERGEMLLTFFNQLFRLAQLKAGTVGYFSGKVSEFNGRRQLLHPDLMLLDEDTDLDTELDAQEAGGGLVPIYPATARLQTWTIAKSVARVLPEIGDVEDPLADEIREREGFVDLRTAYEYIHRPDNLAQVEAAQNRLRFDEAFVVQIELARQRAATERLPAVARRPRPGGLLDRFDSALPFTLTAGQREIGELLTDELARGRPMHRLLQGEVGSGKTVVALRAMLQVVDAGGQTALLAPTEVLAVQHHRSISTMLGTLAGGGMLGGDADATRVRLLTGSMGARARRDAIADVASGEAGIVVGTHAILEDVVTFADLGLVVVDEQHRFGVEQRAVLGKRAGEKRAHTLVMTATPIPRTVAMTVFGDLETSTLSELPAGRKPIQTTVVPAAARPGWLQRCWDRIVEEVEQGHQAYVVCARIGDGDDAGDVDERGLPRPQAAVELFGQLTSGPLADINVELLHGRLPAETKDVVMSRFATGETDVLVSTTVIEVGVDVADASTMVVMDAERFGISQLHQLRGRVGRGAAPGLCLLVTQAPVGSPPYERLSAVAGTSDGFELSRLDLETRREGNVLGVSQSGRRSALRLLSVLDHEDIIVRSRSLAEQIIADDPTLDAHPALDAAVGRFARSRRSGYLDKS
ncbi:MAG: ATP-dependent DNA helicase RecG [Actinomycetota bacterium]|nr:ATP-dependent DNA helicase RecG [Actinomycetota bacterium]